MNIDFVRADSGFDASNQLQILTEHRPLGDNPFAPQSALVVVPALPVACQSRGDRADPPVNGVANAFPGAVNIVIGRLIVHEQDVIETASHQKP